MAMKTLSSLIIGLLFTFSAFSQSGEFTTYPNGLIYSEYTMKKLSSIVDSLNLKFKTCDFNKSFQSIQQVVGHLVTLEKGDITAAKRDLEQNISFQEFCSKYPNAEIERNVLILRTKFTNYSKEEIVKIKHFDLESDYGFTIQSEDLSDYEKDLKDKWLFRHRDKSEYYKESLTAFFFPENFQTRELPKKYSLMIGYSECLIDTTTQKFKEELDRDVEGLPQNWKALSFKKKVLLLDDLRSTRVVGSCSQDDSPRMHAVNIALVSAETYQWEVFLKAHLDIMNDRFERVSDGSYAYGARQTYIRELEELNINVTDLILGISFRVENPASNHYYGSINRVGRALSETKNKPEIEKTILSIIEDSELDYFNRLLFYYLFKNYNYHLKDEKIKKENDQKLEIAASKLPDYFSSKLKMAK